MNIILKSPKTDPTYLTTLPCSEEELQTICDKLGIENTASTEVYTSSAHLTGSPNPLFNNKMFNLDELNFLLKRLDSFDKAEKERFYATAYALKYTEAKDLINLTFNTHCFGVVADFSDLNKVGKSIYLNEMGGIPSSEFEDFDGKEYLEDLMQNHPNPMITPNGIVFQNSNEFEICYNGKNFPAYWWKSNPITMCLSTDTANEYLYLPIAENELTKALQRLEVEHILDCYLAIETDELPVPISNIVFEDTSIPNLNEFAKRFDDIGEYKHLSKLVEFTKVTTIPDLKILLDCWQEFEMFENIHSPKAYGMYMLCASERFEYDANFEDYIDFERYGIEKTSTETGAFTEKGYVLYHGYNKEMENILHKNLGIEFKQLVSQQELNLYMPLTVTSYQDENDYGDMETVDYEVEIENSDALDYFEEIAEALHNETLILCEKRGLMKYYGVHDSVNAKVQKYIFDIEEVDGRLMGVATLTLNDELNPQELEKIKSEIEGQASDGFCEGFEQRDIDVGDRKINAHLWNSDEWSLKTAEELGITEQKHETGGISQ